MMKHPMKKVVTCAALSAIALLAIVLSASPSQASVLGDGGDRLIMTQNDAGGWDWKLDDGDPTSGSATNTAGPIGMGLLAAYAHTGDVKYLDAAVDAGDFIVDNSPPHSTGNGLFMAALSDVTGNPGYASDVKGEYYDALVAGTYEKNGVLYTTAGFTQYIYDLRNSQGYGNMGIWDVGVAAAGAGRLGAAQSQLDIFGDQLEAGLNAWEGVYATGNSSYSVLGLAGGILGLAAMGQDSLDAQINGGSHLDGLQTIGELADALTGYQAPGGGFGKYADYPLDPYTGVQATAYAILALNEVDPVLYADNISRGANWLADVQMATGGWGGTFAGASDENNEVTGEAMWAVGASIPEPASFLIWACLGLIVSGGLNRRR